MPVEEKKDPKAEQDILDKLDKYFRSSLDHPTWVQFRKDAVTCFRYKEGDQWTSAEKKVLKERGQPVTVNNQIKVTIDRMVGQFVRQRTRMGYRGRNAQDVKSAEVLSDILLFIKQNNDFEYEEREAAEDGFTCGMGVIEASVTFDDLANPEIRLRAIDPFEIFCDPNSRQYDWNEDAAFISRAKWVDLDEAIELYPGKKADIYTLVNSTGELQDQDSDSFENKNYVDANKRRVRLVETWYKVKRKEMVLIGTDGSVIDLTDLNEKDRKEAIDQYPNMVYMDRVGHRMKVAIHTANVLLEVKDVDNKFYPFIPYFVNRKKNGQPYSQVLLAIPLQDAINKRESKAIHLLNANQTISEDGAILDKEDHALEKSLPDGDVVLARGALSQGKYLVKENVELARTQYELHNQGKADLRNVTGINPDALGERSEMRSGVGVARKQQATDLITAPVFDNFRRTRAILARVVLELIQRNYTQKKIFSITDDINATRVVAINDIAEDGMTPINPVSQGVFDVIVEDMPDTTTVQQEQLQTIGGLLPQILPFGPFWAKLLFQISDVRNKDEIIKMLDAQSQPPPPEPKYSLNIQWAELPPGEKIAFANKLGMQDLAQAIGQNPQDSAHVTRAKVDMQKEALRNQGEQAKGANERIKGQTELIKGQVASQKAQQEAAIAGMKGQLDLAKSRLDVEKAELAVRKAELEVAKKQREGG